MTMDEQMPPAPRTHVPGPAARGMFPLLAAGTGVTVVLAAAGQFDRAERWPLWIAALAVLGLLAVIVNAVNARPQEQEQEL